MPPVTTSFNELFNLVNNVIMVINHGVDLSIVSYELERLVTFLNGMNPADCKIGNRISLTKELTKIVSMLSGLKNAMEDGEISKKRVNVVVNDLTQCMIAFNNLVVQKVHRNYFLACYERDHKKHEIYPILKVAYSAYVNAIDDARAAYIKHSNKALALAVDNSNISMSCKLFESDKLSLITQLNKSKSFANNGICGVKTTIGIVTRQPVTQTRLSVSGITFVFVHPVLFLRGQQFLAITVDNDDMVVEAKLPMPEDLVKIEGIEPNIRYIDVLNDKLTEVPRHLSCRGINGVKFIWLMDTQVRDKLGTLSIMNAAFPF